MRIWLSFSVLVTSLLMVIPKPTAPRSNLMWSWKCGPKASPLMLSQLMPLMKSEALWQTAMCWLQEADRWDKKWSSTNWIEQYLRSSWTCVKLRQLILVLLTWFCCLRDTVLDTLRYCIDTVQDGKLFTVYHSLNWTDQISIHHSAQWSMNITIKKLGAKDLFH